jgi:hypothetical protein
MERESEIREKKRREDAVESSTSIQLLSIHTSSSHLLPVHSRSRRKGGPDPNNFFLSIELHLAFLPIRQPPHQ